MKILIDIGHPGHVHLFKHFAHAMIARGHQVHFTVRDKEFEMELLSHEGFSFTNFGKHYHSKSGKIWGLIKFTWLVIKTALRFKPDILLSHGSLYTAFASFFIGKPNIAMEDTGNSEQVNLYKPFTKAILTSTSFLKNYGKKQIFYKGYHELAYLHPELFTPDSSVLHDLGIGEGEKYCILRFVSWNATHDVGLHGLTLENKLRIVKEFSQYARVFISSEKLLPAELRKYKLPTSPEKIHHVMAFSTIFFGESATMAAEAAMLGVPAFFLDNTGRFYTRELGEKYGMVYNYSESEADQAEAIRKALELLSGPDFKEEYQKRRHKMLSEKINTTEFLIWFIENYPESFSIMKKSPSPAPL
jgi:uncharacterized protein